MSTDPTHPLPLAIARRTALKALVASSAALVASSLPPLSLVRRAAAQETEGDDDDEPRVAFAQCGSRDELKVAITIDDWNSAWIVENELLPLLEGNPDVKITAFPVGLRMARLDSAIPGVWAALLAAGHEIGYHSLYHRSLVRATAEKLRTELETFNEIVRELTGDDTYEVRYGRAPYGNYGDRVAFQEIAEEMGITWLLWSTVPPTASEPLAVTAGDIPLFHDRGVDMYWLERYIAKCREMSLEMVSLSDLTLVEW